MRDRVSVALGAVVLTLGVSACERSEPLAPAALEPAFAKVASSSFTYFFAPPDAGNSSATASNGQTLEMSLDPPGLPPFGLPGASFGLHPKSIDGTGTFTQKDASGNVLASGTWNATRLISFKSFGTTDAGGGVIVIGGTLIAEVQLSTGQKAVLKLTCTDFGNPPPGRVQSMTLNIQGGPHFEGDWSVPGFGGTFFQST